MSSSSSQVGYLVPLNQNLEDEKEEKASIPKLPISKGTNILGRNNLTVSDKRLSRKHLTITASTDGSANLLVVLKINNEPFLHNFSLFYNEKY